MIMVCYRKRYAFFVLLLFIAEYCRGNSFSIHGESLLYKCSLLGQNMNDASLAGFSSVFLYASVKRKFLIKELNENTMVFGFPAGKGLIAASYKDYGLTTYHERTTSLHYARDLSPGFACGLRMIWHRNSFDDEHYVDKDYYSFALSVLSRIGKKSLIDLQLANPVCHPSAEFPPSGIHPELSAGIECFVSSSASIKAELIQRRGMKTFAGLKMNIIQKNRFLISAGMGINPGTCNFCCAWRIRGLIVSIRADWQPELGLTPETAIFAGFERSK